MIINNYISGEKLGGYDKNPYSKENTQNAFKKMGRINS